MKKFSFTLIEIIMVITIIGILALVSIPRFEVFYSVKLQGAVKKLVRDIRYVQTLSITTNNDYKINFDTAGNSYSVVDPTTGNSVIDPFTRDPLSVDFDTNNDYKGVDIATADFNGTAVLHFNYKGEPLDGSGNSLSTEGTVTLSFKGSSYKITITPQTGLVRTAALP